MYTITELVVESPLFTVKVNVLLEISAGLIVRIKLEYDELNVGYPFDTTKFPVNAAPLISPLVTPDIV